MTFETLAVVGFIFGIFAMAAAVFAVGLSARAVEVSGRSGGSGGTEAAAGGGGPSSVDVEMKEFAFDPNDIKIAADGKLILSNNGAMAHDLAIGDLASEMIDPGGKGELDLKGLAPGEYTFICQVAGHEAAGMKGKITVS
ncbi:MAG TPA: cupredoxin domain-containing protein [Microthrixaceae bacterium]|nr:cupredoxin domain-containing protein [Microthrixaceae bacterium]